MKRTKVAGQDWKNPVPRFRRRNGNGKNPDGQGFKSGDFFAYFAEKYYSSLDRLDRRNGRDRYIVIVSENLLKSINKLCLRLLIIYHLGYALRVIKYSFGRWYIDER